MKKIYVALLAIVLSIPLYAWAKTDAFPLEYQIEGLTGRTQAYVLSQLKAAQTTASQPTNAEAITALSQQGHTVIRKALEPFGYFKPNIRSLLKQQNDHWIVYYYIQPGPPIKIAKINLSITGAGKINPKLQKFIQQFPLQTGHVLLMEKYNQTKQAFFNISMKEGYLKANLRKHQVVIDRERYTAAIELQFDTGPRYYFGSVTFSQTPYKESFLRRYLPFKEGQPYSTDDILSLQQTLNGSSYFQQVSVAPQIEQAQDFKVPIAVNLTARKAHQFTTGLGYGTDTGARGSFGWEWRRVTNTGQRLAALVRLSQVTNSFQTTYIIPGKNPAKDQYNIYSNYTTEYLNQGNSRTLQLGTSYAHYIGNWQQTIALNYQIIHSQLDSQPALTSTYLIPSISWQKSQANDALFPTQGHRINFTLQGAKQNFFSRTNFLQGKIQAKFINSFAEKYRIIYRGDVGYTIANAYSDLPLPLQFLAGGTQSVRGYDYQSLGPGRYLTVGSVELQRQIVDKWHGAVFYDIGNAMDSFTTSLNKGIGVGIVWVSPIGPVELTVAKAISLPGKPLRIQFSMGPSL